MGACFWCDSAGIVACITEVVWVMRSGFMMGGHVSTAGYAECCTLPLCPTLQAKHLSDLPASTTATPSAPPAASPTAPTQTLLCGVHTAQPLPEHVSTTVLSTHAPSSSASSVASVASMTRGEGKLSAMLLVTPAHLAAQLPEAEAEAGAETGAGRAGPSQPDTPDAVLVTSRCAPCLDYSVVW